LTKSASSSRDIKTEALAILEATLSVFREAVRAKPNWFNKILDEGHGLGRKWASEANLLLFDESGQEVAIFPVLASIEQALFT
jgi:hypothetical protein